MTADGVPKQRGRPGLDVPSLGKKIEYLLRRLARPQNWLTEMLTSASGQKPSATSISNWKESGRIPFDYVASFCVVFTIDEATLCASEDMFYRLLEPDAMIGSGSYWKRLIEDATEAIDGLSLEIDGDSPHGTLKNVVFGHEAKTLHVAPIQQVPMDKPIRFSIPAASVRCLEEKDALLDATKIMLFCEDRQGWRIIAPHIRDPGFGLDGNRWLLPQANRGPLLLEPPLGGYQAIALIFNQETPDHILRELRAGRAVQGLDALASWILRESVVFKMYKRHFLVVAPLRR